MHERAAGLLALLIGMSSGAGRQASAQTKETSARDDRAYVRLMTTECPHAHADVVRKLVAIELHVQFVEDLDGRVTRVFARCSDETAEIVVDDPLTGKRLSRRYDTSRTEPEVFSRTLALAIVELVAASWTELELDPSPTPLALRKRDQTANDGSRMAVRDVLRRKRRDRFPRLRIGGQGRIKSGVDTALVGGAAIAIVDVGPWFSALLDLGYVAGTRSTHLGEVSAKVVDGALVACFGVRRDAFGLCAGPGVRAGFAWLRGRATSGDVESGAVTASFFAPILFGSASVRLFPSFSAQLVLESGYVADDVDGGTVEGRAPITLGPFFYGGGIGVLLEL